MIIKDDILNKSIIGTNEELLDCPSLNWGILGCGRISHDFVQALKLVPSANVVACGGRSSDSACRFAETHDIPHHYSSYDDLLKDENVQVVYVGTIHISHHDVGIKCLLSNKHVVIEKPIVCNAEQVESLVKLARERNCFLMEAMWTRFFPAVEHAKLLALGTPNTPGVIGDVVSVQSDFNFNAVDCEEYPTSPCYNRDLGGGASYWIGSYPIEASTLFHGGKAPTHLVATGFVDPHTQVDLQASISLKYPPPNHSSQGCIDEEEKKGEVVPPSMPICPMSTLTFGFLGESREETTIVGTRGRIILETPSHCPTRVTVEVKGQGRGNASLKNTFEYPLPEETNTISACGGFHFPNSQGLAYQAAAVARCIHASLEQCPQHSLDATLLNTQIMDEVRAQLGFCV